MKTNVLYLVAASLAYVLTSAAAAQVVATKGPVKSTLEDFPAYHLLSSPDKQMALRGSPQELENTFNEVLIGRLYKARPDLQPVLTPLEKQYVDIQVERSPVLAALNVVEVRVRSAFKTTDPLTMARARELWVLDEKQYWDDDQADITQIFFDSSKRPYAETAARIAEVQAKLKAGASLDSLVMEYSDEKQIATTKGKVKSIGGLRSDPLMGSVIFNRLKVNEISDPVPSRVGLHIVRLDEKRTRKKMAFETVAGRIYEQIMEEAVKNARLDLLAKLNSVPTEFVQTVMEDFLLKGDPNADQKRREIYKDMGIPVSQPLPAKK